MKYYEVRDIVRENVGRDKAAQHQLDWSLQQGLREIEKEGNFYWMRAVKTFSLVVNQQGYSITTSTDSGLNIPNYKDARILLVSDQTLDNPDWGEVFGPVDIEEASLEFADTDTGQPIIWSLDEAVATKTQTDPLTAASSPSILVWPNLPDKTYSMRLHYFQWTSLPSDTTSQAHEVLLRWPEALIYLATEVLLTSLTKDPQYGAVWRQKFANREDGELRKIRRYDKDRARDSRTELRPMRGPYQSRRRAWNRSREIWR